MDINKKYFIAIDIGATSGRHIVGWKEDGQIKTDEVYRFSNFPTNSDYGEVWDIERIFSEVKNGIKKAFIKYGKIESLSIDTWGVDYVLIKDGKAIYPCYCYRSKRTYDVIKEVHKIITFEQLYDKTGIQFQSFNSIYQLYRDKLDGRLETADAFLMIPEYLNYMLTGIIKKEYTNATTTGLLNCNKKIFDKEIITKLSFQEKLFGSFYMPGEAVGELKSEIAAEVGGTAKVVLCASHDTASAFEAINLKENSLLISSGTWSLLGAKLQQPLINEKARKANFTNEGGVNYIRFLKNIAGLYLMTLLAKQTGCSYKVLEKEAACSSYKEIFDINDPVFLTVSDIRKTISEWFLKKRVTCPEHVKDYANSIYHTIAFEYAKTISQISMVTGKQFEALYIVGGGAKDKYLCELTAKYSNIKVEPLPIEATSIGNLKIQMAAKGEI